MTERCGAPINSLIGGDTKNSWRCDKIAVVKAMFQRRDSERFVAVYLCGKCVDTMVKAGILVGPGTGVVVRQG